MFFSVAVNSFSAPRFSQKKCILLCSFNFHLAWGRTGLLKPLTCRCQGFSKYFTSLCICLDSAIGVFSSAVEGCLQALYMITRRISISNAKMLLTAMAMTAPVDKAALIADRREGSRARRRVTAAGRGGVRRLGSARLCSGYRPLDHPTPKTQSSVTDHPPGYLKNQPPHHSAKRPQSAPRFGRSYIIDMIALVFRDTPQSSRRKELVVFLRRPAGWKPQRCDYFPFTPNASPFPRCCS